SCGLAPFASISAPARRPAKLTNACATMTPRPGASAAITAAPPMQDAPAAPTSCVSGSTATIDHVAPALAGASQSVAAIATTRRNAGTVRGACRGTEAARRHHPLAPRSSQSLIQRLTLLIHFVRQATAELLEEFPDVLRVAPPILGGH